MPDLVRVFISYSHDSDAHRERIRDLATRLRGHGIDAWIDQFSPAPVEGWPRWMEQQFAQARFVVVACTEPYAERFNRPPGVGSGVGWEAVLIRQELYEQGGNTRFVPVYFEGKDSVVPLVLRPYPRYFLPRDYEHLCKHLLGKTGKDVPPLGSLPAFEGARPDVGGRSAVKLWNVPPRPAQYLPREELDALKVSLISSRTQTVAIAGEHHRLGIQGMPGVGKTVLAAALAADPEIHEAFPGGVFWLTLGRTPDDVAVWQGNLAEVLAGHRVEIRTVREGKTKLAQLFAARPPSLLVLDDVWNIADADPFDAPAAPSRLLITTRDQRVAKGLGATVREIRELKPTDALAMLAAYAELPIDTLPKVAKDIVQECGELPLAVAMAGAMLQGNPEDQWPTLLEQLKNADLEHLAAALPQYREHLSMLAAIEVSVQALPEDVRLRYLDFAVFPEDTEIPERVLHRLWGAAGVTLFTAQQTVNTLADRSLVRRVRRSRDRDADRRAAQPDPSAPPPKNEEVLLTLHDLQHDYVRARGGELALRHARLIEAYRSTSPGQALHAVEADGYFFEHIAKHVRDGEGTADLRALLFDHRWLAAKLKATGMNALLADFELLDLAKDEPLRLLRNALRLSGHVLSRNPEELPSQMLGRLRGAPELELRHLCTRVEADAAPPVFIPRWPRLQPPGNALLRTLEGHAGRVTAVGLSGDGKTAVSGSDNGTMKAWDVTTGKERRTLGAHAGRVTAVGLTADSKMVVSGDNGTVRVWVVETGRERRTLRGGPAIGMKAVAMSADGKTAISGCDDGTVKVWDVETGRVRRTVEHASQVNVVALSADGNTAVSSNDGTVKVWDVETGQVRRTLEGHAGWVRAVALSADGKTALSGSSDTTLKVWDVDAGKERRTLQGHFGPVTAVGLSADGKTAVSSSDDGTMKAWDVDTGKERRTLQSHFGPVTAVGLSADGKMAISGSDDGMVKLWDMDAGGERQMLEGHASGVKSLLLGADGKTVVSRSDDERVKVWDMETGKEWQTLRGNHGWLSVVVFDTGGETTYFWDSILETWKKMPLLKGHDIGMEVGSFNADRETDSWVSREMFRGMRESLLGKSPRSDSVSAVRQSEDGKIAVCGYHNGTVKIWDVEKGLRPGSLEGHAGPVRAVALSADGKTVISGSDDGTLIVWGLEIGKERRMLNGHASPVRAVLLSPDERMIVSSSEDRTLKAWDIETGSCLASFTGDAAFTAVALGPSLRVFAGDLAGHVHLLELRLGPAVQRGPQS